MTASPHSFAASRTGRSRCFIFKAASSVCVSEQPKPIETFAKCEDAENQVNMFIIETGLEMIDHVCHS